MSAREDRFWVCSRGHEVSSRGQELTRCLAYVRGRPCRGTLTEITRRRNNRLTGNETAGHNGREDDRRFASRSTAQEEKEET